MNTTASNRPSPAIQLGILFALVGACLFLCLFLVKISLPILFGIKDPDLFIVSTEQQQKMINASLFMQSLASTWGMFLLPALIFTQVMRYRLGDFFKINTSPKLLDVLYAVIIIIAGGIFINLIVFLTKMIPLPESLASLRHTQEATEKLIQAFFSKNSWTHFAILLIVLAALPAIAEELFFRGVIQTLLQRTALGATGAIIISSLSFSLMHLEFDNFFAIWFMGIVLGYLYFITQNLWISIIAHFINNALMISMKYAFMNGLLSKDFSESNDIAIPYTLGAGIIMFLLLYYLSKSKANLSN
jgi:membrane protease YdiL (CAAX protease family)